MSWTEIFVFTKKGNVHKYASIHNSYRGGPMIWQVLEEKYLPPNIPYGSRGGHLSRLSEPKECQKIWDLAKDTRLSEDERIVLLTTFDRIIVKRKDIPKVIIAFNNFYQENRTAINPEAVILNNPEIDPDKMTEYKISTDLKNWYHYETKYTRDNLIAQSEILEKIYNTNRYIAVAYNQTSCNGSDCFWYKGKYNRKEQCWDVPYNMLKQKKHLFLFKDEK